MSGGARAEIAIGDAGAASLAPSLVRMLQLTSLDLGSTLRGAACAFAAPHACSPGDAHGCGLRGADRGACVQRCSRPGATPAATLGGHRAGAKGAAERAENRIDEAGAACLAPVLVRLTRLKSLGLDRTLRASLALVPVKAVRARGGGPGRPSGFFVLLWFRKAYLLIDQTNPKTLPRTVDRKCPGGTVASAAMCAGNYIRDAAAASLAPILARMPQLTSLDLSCMLCIAGVGAGLLCTNATAAMGHDFPMPRLVAGGLHAALSWAV